MLGYSEETITSMTALDIHPQDELAQILTAFEDQTRKGGKIMVSDIPCLRHDGSVMYADVKATLVTFNGVGCNLGFFTDVTARLAAEAERKELESRLHRSEKMEAIGLLAGGVAHDLNNILSGLVSYPELLLMDLPMDSPLRGPVKTIEDSGKRAAAIVQDLLTLARRGVAVSEVTNLNRVVTNYLQSAEHEKLRKYHPGVVFDVNLADGLLDILGSPVHLSKTIMNLVSNAAEAMEAKDGGQLKIETKYSLGEDKLQVDFKDTGIGIPEKNIPKLFEPFFTTKKKGKGVGLGLSVAYGIIQEHGGSIYVKSKVGEGTTFHVKFPLKRASAKLDPHGGVSEQN
jgi:PAS domain S-box-containing protein